MSDQVKRSISEVFVCGMNQLELGGMTLEEFHQMTDLVAKAVPGDERQQCFYGAIKELATKVSANKFEGKSDA